MSTKRDYYEILGVERSASADDIKKAYRKLAMRYHPDRVAEDKKKQSEEKFKEISESYAVLSDEKKRQLYDQYGHAGIDSRYSTEDIFRGADFGGFSDVFEQIFGDFGVDIFGTGGMRRSARRRGGEDVHLEMTISLKEAAFGGEQEVSFYHLEGCRSCQGSGAKPGLKPITCPSCAGRGMVSSGMGFFNFSQPCPSCGGAGQVIKDRCSSCRGEGRVKVKKKVKVTIPQGVDTGSVLRLKEEGHFAQGGKGDLYIHIGVKQHESFQRNGDTLKCIVAVSVFKAMLGAEIEVPTLTGPVKMHIPEGTQPNTVFRLKGKGVVNLRTKRVGDQLVVVDVQVPKKLSSIEKRALLELAKTRKEL